MLQAINYEDMGVVDEFLGGTSLVGSAPTTGLWPAKFTPATMSVSELHDTARRERSQGIRAIEMDPAMAQTVWEQTLAEVLWFPDWSHWIRSSATSHPFEQTFRHQTGCQDEMCRWFLHIWHKQLNHLSHIRLTSLLHSVYRWCVMVLQEHLGKSELVTCRAHIGSVQYILTRFSSRTFLWQCLEKTDRLPFRCAHCRLEVYVQYTHFLGLLTVCGPLLLRNSWCLGRVTSMIL